jgi:hypothetical protein
MLIRNKSYIFLLLFFYYEVIVFIIDTHYPLHTKLNKLRYLFNFINLFDTQLNL